MRAPCQNDPLTAITHKHHLAVHCSFPVELSVVYPAISRVTLLTVLRGWLSWEMVLYSGRTVSFLAHWRFELGSLHSKSNITIPGQCSAVGLSVEAAKIILGLQKAQANFVELHATCQVHRILYTPHSAGTTLQMRANGKPSLFPSTASFILCRFTFIVLVAQNVNCNFISLSFIVSQNVSLSC